MASSLETYCTTRGILTSQTSNITIATVPIGSAHPVPTITVDVQRLVQVTNVVGHQLSVARGRVVVRGNIGERWRCTDAGHLAGEQTVRGVLGAHQDTGVRATDGLPEGEGEQRSRPRYFHQVSWFTRLGLGVRPIRISDSGTHIGIQNGGVKGNSEVVAWGRPPSSIVVVPICQCHAVPTEQQQKKSWLEPGHQPEDNKFSVQHMQHYSPVHHKTTWTNDMCKQTLPAKANEKNQTLLKHQS